MTAGPDLRQAKIKRIKQTLWSCASVSFLIVSSLVNHSSLLLKILQIKLEFISRESETVTFGDRYQETERERQKILLKLPVLISVRFPVHINHLNTHKAL